MPPMSVLIKPSSGNCNLRCKYCFYYDTMSKRLNPSFGFMTEDTLEYVIKNVLAFAQGECSIAYQGGEPTLIGLDFYKKSIELQDKYNVNHVKIYNSIQTNGYNCDKSWAEFFVQNHFLVGLSLDGIQKVHNLYRVNTKGEGSFYKVMESIKLFKKHGVQFNILSVVNGKSALSLEHNYEFYKRHKLKFLQFIACLDPIGEEPGKLEYSLTPELYGEFLIKLFNLWYKDLLNGEQPYIRQFENYIAILLGSHPESCDMRGTCGKQYVVEADGSVYPCDFYVLEQYCLGNFRENSAVEIDEARKKMGFIEQSYTHHVKCKVCKYYFVCRSGCKRNRQTEEPYQQYFCKSYQMFFDACLPKMMEIAMNIQKN